MKKTVLLGALFLVVAVLVMGSAQKDKRTKTADHDINGELDGTYTFVMLPNGTTPYDVDTLGVASGQVKGLGQTSIFTIHRPTTEGTVIDGHVWIVAANGDKIKGTFVGTTEWDSKLNKLVGKADWVIMGGTGRFANASGIISTTAFVTMLGFDVWEWPATWVLEGTISY